MVKRNTWFKPLNQLTREELNLLFPYINSYPDKFLDKYGIYSVVQIVK